MLDGVIASMSTLDLRQIESGFACSTAARNGLTLSGTRYRYFIFGMDGNSMDGNIPEVFAATRDFIEATNLLESKVTVWTALPGMRLYLADLRTGPKPDSVLFRSRPRGKGEEGWSSERDRR